MARSPTPTPSRSPAPASAAPPTGWTPLAPTQTVAQRVAAVLRERILRGTYPPGTFIRQEDVASGLAVSRMPVREALAELVSEGFVRRVPRRGFQIPERSTEALLELYPILTSLEQLACRASLPELTAPDLRKLREINRSIHRAIPRPDAAATALELNLEFHGVLASRCDNGRLRQFLDQLGREIFQLEFWSFSQPTHRQLADRAHDDIIAALERRRYARCLALIEENRLLAYRAFQEQAAATPKI